MEICKICNFQSSYGGKRFRDMYSEMMSYGDAIRNLMPSLAQVIREDDAMCLQCSSMLKMCHTFSDMLRKLVANETVADEYTDMFKDFRKISPGSAVGVMTSDIIERNPESQTDVFELKENSTEELASTQTKRKSWKRRDKELLSVGHGCVHCLKLYPDAQTLMRHFKRIKYPLCCKICRIIIFSSKDLKVHSKVGRCSVRTVTNLYATMKNRRSRVNRTSKNKNHSCRMCEDLAKRMDVLEKVVLLNSKSDTDLEIECEGSFHDKECEYYKHI